MARKKGSTSTVMLSEKQLTDICGEGSLVCVPKRWLKELGFDPEQKSQARVLTVHQDGKEVWSYHDWEAEKARLEMGLRKADYIVKVLSDEIAEAKREGRWFEDEPMMPTEGMTEDELRSYDRKRCEIEVCSHKRRQLDQYLEKKEATEKELREFD
jgi:hypothetical protein